MNMPSLPASLAALLSTFAVLGAHAGADNYQEAIGAYKNELKPKDPELINDGFYGDRASSVAKRAIDRADIERRVNSVNTDERGLLGNGGDVNVASPQIFGTVRGDVTVVMQRGAVRGSITSVKR